MTITEQAEVIRTEYWYTEHGNGAEITCFSDGTYGLIVWGWYGDTVTTEIKRTYEGAVNRIKSLDGGEAWRIPRVRLGL